LPNWPVFINVLINLLLYSNFSYLAVEFINNREFNGNW